MSPPRHHAAPMGLAGVLFGFTCSKHAAPTELAASVVSAGTWQPYGRRPRFETVGYCHGSLRAGRMTKWRPKASGQWVLSDSAGVLLEGVLNWGHVCSSF